MPLGFYLFGFEIRLPRFSKKEKRRAERVRTYEELYLDYRSLENSASGGGTAGFSQPSQRVPTGGSGEARDVSVTGIRFISKIKYPPGTLLDLKLRFAPGSTPIPNLEVRGRVKRAYKLFRLKGYRVGCVFESLSEEARQAIEQFVKWAKVREKKYLFFRWR